MYIEKVILIEKIVVETNITKSQKRTWDIFSYVQFHPLLYVLNSKSKFQSGSEYDLFLRCIKRKRMKERERERERESALSFDH